MKSVSVAIKHHSPTRSDKRHLCRKRPLDDEKRRIKLNAKLCERLLIRFSVVRKNRSLAVTLQNVI